MCCRLVTSSPRILTGSQVGGAYPSECCDEMCPRPVCQGVAEVRGEEGGEEEDTCLQVQS